MVSSREIHQSQTVKAVFLINVFRRSGAVGTRLKDAKARASNYFSANINSESSAPTTPTHQAAVITFSLIEAFIDVRRTFAQGPTLRISHGRVRGNLFRQFISVG